MSRFNRQWTISLNVSNQDFLDAFRKVVRDDATIVLEKPFVFSRNPHKDFFGAAQSHSFRMWKRKGLLDIRGVPELYGKIIDKDGQTKLDLRMINNFRFNYFSIFISDIVIGLFLLLLFNAITGIASALTGVAETVYFILATLVLIGIAHYFQLKLIDKYLNNLQAAYNQTLLAIEETVRKNHAAVDNDLP